MIMDLDHDEFARRGKAAEGLRQIGQAAERILLETVKGDCHPEVRLRVTKLLQAFQPPFPETPSEALRGLRVIRILERIGTEGKETLESLAAPPPRSSSSVSRPWLPGKMRTVGHRLLIPEKPHA